MTDDKETKLLWLNFLKAFTRALVQINLYKPDHPQVKTALEESHTLLGKIIETSPNNEFTLTLDNDKLIVNGFPLLTADKLPNSLKNIFIKFHVQTVSFLSGVSANDIMVFCQMQTFKGNGVEYLKQNNIEKISLSEAIYAKVDKAQENAAVRPDTAAQQPAAEQVQEKIASQNLEGAIETLVNKLTPNADEQRRITEMVMKKLKSEIEAEVAKAVEEMRKEKKKIENDMARTEAVISNIADGVVVVDKEGKILMMNPQAEAISGKALSDLSGQKIFDVPHLENQVISLAKEIKSENSRDISKEMAQKGPSDLSAAIKKSTAIIQNEDGKIVGAVSIPTDQAKLKEMEQLQKDFIANMTHELRSPLTSIKAALEILAKEAPPEMSSRSMLNTAIRNSERLNSIITDILDFSKLQSGKMVFSQESVKPEDLAKEAHESMKAWASTKDLNLTIKAGTALQNVFVDKRKTTQVLINLISNAIKFTPQNGSIEIGVDAGMDAMSGFVFLSVKDTGCGIKKEDQTKIFEKFVQVAAGDKVGGTGLGLAITKAMVIMQGGKITVESEPGHGATFRVAMPVYRGQLDNQVFEQLPEVKEEKAWWKKLLGI